MIDLLQRYLATVERRLPEAQAKDIVAELGDVLSAKIEAGEAARGRPANADEVAAELKAFGHPVVVASRYSGNDHVIGPNYYPWFWHVQRIALGLGVAIAFGLTTVRSLGAGDPVRAAMHGVNSAIEAGLLVFAVVTALFIVVERTKLDISGLQRWDPKSLPREHIRQPKSLFESAVMVAFDIVFLLFWVRALQFPNEIPVREGASAALAFSPAWDAVYWPVLVLAVGVTLVHLSDIIHPAWTRLRSVLSIAGHVAGLAILWVLFNGRPLIAATPVDGADPTEIERVLQVADSVVTISLGVAAAIWVAAIILEFRRLWRVIASTKA